jgi:hypothetical protein
VTSFCCLNSDKSPTLTVGRNDRDFWQKYRLLPAVPMLAEFVRGGDIAGLCLRTEYRHHRMVSLGNWRSRELRVRLFREQTERDPVDRFPRPHPRQQSTTQAASKYRYSSGAKADSIAGNARLRRAIVSLFCPASTRI